MNEEEILKKYKRTDEEHEEYYQTIKRIYVGGKTPQKNPVSIIVGGQTGAGKSGILGYSYSIDGINYSEISTKTVYEIKNLSSNQIIVCYKIHFSLIS